MFITAGQQVIDAALHGVFERVLPGVVRQDPFLRDEERAELERISGGSVSLPSRAARIEEEALLFGLAVDAARQSLVCSYPRYEAGTGKELIPSSYLRGLEPLSGEPVRERSIFTPRRTAGEGGTVVRGPVSEDEYDLIEAYGVRSGAGSLAPNRFLARGIAMVKARWGTRR